MFCRQASQVTSGQKGSNWVHSGHVRCQVTSGKVRSHWVKTGQVKVNARSSQVKVKGKLVGSCLATWGTLGQLRSHQVLSSKGVLYVVKSRWVTTGHIKVNTRSSGRDLDQIRRVNSGENGPC